MPWQTGATQVSPKKVEIDTQGRPLALLRLPEVMRRCGKGRSDIYRSIAAGTFPRPVHLTPRSRAWAEHEVAAWIEDRLAQRERALKR